MQWKLLQDASRPPSWSPRRMDPHCGPQRMDPWHVAMLAWKLKLIHLGLQPSGLPFPHEAYIR